MKNYNYTYLDRFLKYVQIDTTSDPHSKSFPSTEKQKNLSAELVKEMNEMGIENAYMDDWGYVYASIPSNTDKKVPALCFCSHIDTSSDVSGTDVKPIVHTEYDGKKLFLPDDKNSVIDPEEFTYLKKCIGHDIITASGKTLLGADDKAGVAEIMDAANYFIKNPGVKHGDIKILFTPDEETGRGVEKLDLSKVNADFGYTMDGGKAGDFEYETFSADSLILEINGFSTHPGTAKNKMENAVKIASEIISRLPAEMSPEATEKREGFVHPVELNARAEYARISFIIRDFEDDGLSEKEKMIEEIAKDVLSKYKKSSFKITVKESYRNMRKIVSEYPQMIDYAKEAIKMSGIEPEVSIVRGGTDGSKLSFMGLPCPNIFSGGMAIHSKYEFVSSTDMKRAVDTIINLVKIWHDKS